MLEPREGGCCGRREEFRKELRLGSGSPLIHLKNPPRIPPDCRLCCPGLLGARDKELLLLKLAVRSTAFAFEGGPCYEDA